MAFRKLSRKSAAPPALTVYSFSPVIEVTEFGRLVIERLDRPGERYEATLSRESLVKERFHDLAAVSRRLKRGGLYAATLGSRRVVFKIGQFAEPTGTLLSRLVRL